MVLEHMAEGNRAEVMMATHNQVRVKNKQTSIEFNGRLNPIQYLFINSLETPDPLIS